MKIRNILIVSIVIILTISFIFSQVEIDSFKITKDIFTTSSSTPVNVTGLTINTNSLVNQSHVIIWVMTTSSNQSTTGNFVIEVDGITVIDSERVVDDVNKDNVFLQFITDKSLINHTIQAKAYTTGGGEISIINSTLLVFSLNNGVAELASEFALNESESTTTSSTFQVIPGMDFNLTLIQPSRILTTLDLSLKSGATNKIATFVIEVNGTDSPEGTREFSSADEFVTFVLTDITSIIYPAGTYTIRSKWKTETPNTITGKDVHQSSFSLVDDLGNPVILNLTEIVSDTTVSSTFEDIDGLSLNLELKDDGFIFAFFSADTGVNSANQEIFFTLNINGTDTEVVEIGHDSQTKKRKIRQVTRSDTKFPKGNHTIKVRWKTDSGTMGSVDEVTLLAFATSFESCNEDWILNSSACNILDNQTIEYFDANSCGTFDDLPADNGTIAFCDFCFEPFQCTLFDDSCGGGASTLNCLATATTNQTCCDTTNLTSDCFFQGNLSDFEFICGDLDLTLVVPQFPFVDFNVTFPMELIFTQNNITVTLTDFTLNLTDPNGTSQEFNFVVDNSTQTYKLNLLFTEEGDFPFRIFAQSPFDNIPEITGTLIVRKPYFITFEAFEEKKIRFFGRKDIGAYKNKFAVLTAENQKGRRFKFDPILEQYITPLFFNKQFNNSVHLAPYDNGVAVLKLWETGTYGFRLIDGREVKIDGIFGVPNVTDSYGLHSFVGVFTFNGTDENVSVFFDEKDTNQFRWLLNLIFLVLIVAIISISVFLFFVIPQMPQLSIIFGLGFTTMLILLRVFLFIWRGW